MKKIYQNVVFSVFMLLVASSLKAQYLVSTDSAFNAGKPMSGRIWGYTFGDYFYKSHADALNRGGSNQYTNLQDNRNAFQFRRIYLGYDYNFNKKFASEVLLAAEDNSDAGFNQTTGGDQVVSGKYAFYIKLANLRIKNLWKGADLVIGQQSTPAFSGSSEKVWGYRAIERTIADIRRTPSYDLGVGLQGTFDPKTKNYGYNLLVANGTSAKPSNTNNKWTYGDVWAKFLNQKLIVDIYADYNKLNDWSVANAPHRSRQMLKGFVGYNTSPLSVGLEGFINNLKNDVTATKIDGSGTDLLNNTASGISVFVNGDIIKNQLRFFVRYDTYTPTNQVNNGKYNKYVLATGNYNDNSYFTPATLSAAASNPTGDQTYKQDFITLGLDWMPAKNIHIMPNIWYNHYATQLSGDLNNAVNKNADIDLASKAKGDYDLVYRVTFYYTFGK